MTKHEVGFTPRSTAEAARNRERNTWAYAPDPGKQAATFDKGRNLPMNPDVRIGFLQQGTIQFRRTDADRKPPTKVVTAALMGDPKPGRTPWS